MITITTLNTANLGVLFVIILSFARLGMNATTPADVQSAVSEDKNFGSDYSGPTESENSTISPLRHYGNERNPYTYEVVLESARHILDRTDKRPKIGIICGSGLGALAEMLDEKIVFPYDEIPHFPDSTVEGHEGQLVVGNMGKVPVICMQGRFHFYEGYRLWKIAMPVRMLKIMGIEILIVTNAAGGLSPGYRVGDVMIIRDHINFPGFAGFHPLRGNNDDEFGAAFPPMNDAYDRKLRAVARQVATELGMRDFIREGIYGMVGGPTFETVAEARALRTLGVDAVGMSTVPEVITAVHSGIRVFALSLITDESITEYQEDVDDTSHGQVVEAASRHGKDVQKLIETLVPRFYRSEINKM